MTIQNVNMQTTFYRLKEKKNYFSEDVHTSLK